MLRSKAEPFMLLLVSFGVFFFFFAAAGMSEIKSVEASANMHSILVEWKKSFLQETEGIVIVRKENLCPDDAFDGENVYQGNGNSFIDKDVQKNISYCYGAYVYDSSGAISEMKPTGLVKIRSWTEYAGFIIEDNIFIGVGIILIAILAYLNIRKCRKN